MGSNLGDRIAAIDMAAHKLKTLPSTRLTTLSGLYETSAVGIEGDSFINAVAEAQCRLGALILLNKLLEMETAMGRHREPGRTESRFIDLDLLMYGDCVSEEETLILPHPRMLSRRFVMEPLAEIAPNLNIPPSGITASVAATNLAKRCPEQSVKHLGTLEEVKDSLRFEV